MELIELNKVTETDRAELEGDEPDPYGMEALAIRWRPKDVYLGLRSNGRLVAMAGLVVVDIEVRGDGVFEVVGVGDVIVNRAHRGRGYARAVIETALERAERMGPRFTMLFCSERLVPFYEKFSFSEIADPVTVCQPLGAIEMPLRAMSRPLEVGVKWPEGLVKVRGWPF